MKYCGCICYRVPGPIFLEVPYVRCSCDCTVHQICKKHCKLPVMTGIVENCLTHPILCNKYISFDQSSSLGFKGLGFHFGLEIEFDFLGTTEEFSEFLDDYSQSELTNYFIVTTEPSIPNGVEFVSCPMDFYYSYLYLNKLYDFIRPRSHQFAINDKTGIHVHLTKAQTNLENLKEYLSSNTTEIDLFAGRKANQFCNRDFSLNNKQCAIRLTERTVEVRIFRTFEKASEVLTRLRVLERISCKN